MIHEETVQELCNGADWQHKYATNAAARADELTALIGPAEERLAVLRRETAELERQLTPLRRELGEAQQARLKHERLAAEFRELARQQCETNGWAMPEQAAWPDPPADGTPEPRHAADLGGLIEVPALSVMCVNQLCETDPGACEGCVHDCHWRPGGAEKPPAAGNIQPGPAPDPTAEARARTPWAWLLALYVRLLLAERGEGRHAGRRRVFKHRSLVQPEAA